MGHRVVQPRRYMLRVEETRQVFKDDKGNPLYFSKKKEAKAYRDDVSEALVVSPGPDHRSW